jgi:hypothetical protein
MKPHRTDLLSLTFAIIFLAIFGWWVFAQLVHVKVPPAGWWVAFGLILLGLLGLMGAIRSARNANAAAAQRPADPVTDTTRDLEPVPAGSEPVTLTDLGGDPPRGQSHD